MKIQRAKIRVTNRVTNVVVPLLLAAAMWSAQQPGFDWLDLLRSPAERAARRHAQLSWNVYGEQGLYGSVADSTRLSLLLKPRIQDSLSLDYYERQQIQWASWALQREASHMTQDVDRMRAEAKTTPAQFAIAVRVRAVRLRSELERKCLASMADLLSPAQFRRLQSYGRGDDAGTFPRRRSPRRRRDAGTPRQQRRRRGPGRDVTIIPNRAIVSRNRRRAVRIRWSRAGATRRSTAWLAAAGARRSKPARNAALQRSAPAERRDELAFRLDSAHL